MKGKEESKKQVAMALSIMYENSFERCFLY